ncbi:MAG: tetratricopeptide repeat protein [Planctomycetota bacterium]|nr:tetratricopeptide repeat protein [Planctomycetota bacterium]
MNRLAVLGAVLAALAVTSLVCQGESKDTPAEEFQKTKSRAEAGDVDAQYQLAKFYSSGKGTEKNEAEAVKWFRCVARQNDARGQSMLGVMYTNARGVGRNYCQAIGWFRKAAAQNSAHAQYNLGYMYAVGKGVPQDQKQASVWYLKAANQNDAGSQRIMGDRYAVGRGVDKDFVKACAWTQVVVPRGGEAARKQLLAIKSQMTPNQITEAQKLAKEISARLKKSVKQ